MTVVLVVESILALLLVLGVMLVPLLWPFIGMAVPCMRVAMMVGP